MADTLSVLSSESPPLRTIVLPVTDLTTDSFAPYGEVVDVQTDGAPFGARDAQLDLSRGVPRFYLMRLRGRGLRFNKIAHHANSTQCLGSLNGTPWYVGVTRPTIVGDSDKVASEEALKGDGYEYLPPDAKGVRVFRVEGQRFLKFHRGTWHAGPLFEEPFVDFYNLELSRTNIFFEDSLRFVNGSHCLAHLGTVEFKFVETDHTTYNFEENKGIKFEVEKPCS